MVPVLVTITAVVVAGCVVVGIVVVVFGLVVIVDFGIVVVVVAEIISADRVVSGTVALTFVTSLALSSKLIVPLAVIGSVLLVVTGASFVSITGGTVFS